MKDSFDCGGDDRSLDHYARIVRHALKAPSSVVSLVEERRQLFVGASGLEQPYASTRQTPLSHSFCKHVVADGRPLVVTDARHDARVADNPAISELGVVAYAGWPLIGAEGRTVGSVCAIDSRPRSWTEAELAVLADIAQACSAEWQQWERATAVTENLTREIFASVDVALAFYDTDQRLLLANELAWRGAEAAGYRLDTPPFGGPEVRTADRGTLVPPEDQLISRALRGDHAPSDIHWLGPPGRQIAMIGSSRPVTHPDGSLWGTLIAAHDVSRLALALQAKDEFIATVSHELRTPLTSIIGYLEVVTDELDPVPAPARNALAVIERNARNLQRRIGELLDTGDRHRNLEFSTTDLSRLARSVWHTFGERADAAQITFQVEADEPQWAIVDANRIEQVLENLISNALKFTPPGGELHLSVTGTPDAVHITVEDTGHGMSADEVAHATDLFWRAESTHAAAVQGLGIGLTFVRDIVEAHGGTLNITSASSNGTRVTLGLTRSVPRKNAPTPGRENR